MVEISNIDAIIELILREARSRKGLSLVTRIYNVHNEVNRKIGEVMNNFHIDELRKLKKEKDDAVNKNLWSEAPFKRR